MINLKEILNSTQLPLIMGIVNATPDSFSDGGDVLKPIDKAFKLIDDGANILDIGGESTRPGAMEVEISEEINRVLPVIQAVRKVNSEILISVDTRKYEVAKLALEAGASIINDVSNLNFSPQIAELVGSYDAGLILMHSKGNPDTMDNECDYNNLIREIKVSLKNSMDFAMSKGVKQDNIWIDPGLGFAKTYEQNFEILNSIEDLNELAPVLIGHSRKRFIRDFLNVDIKNSDIGTLAISIFSMNQGAKILRVHDVKNSVDAINIYKRCQNA